MTENRKEIHAKDLKWKKVEVGDTLDDFNGFYGLEEIDGVDIKIINGQAHFYSKDGGEVDLNNTEEEKLTVKEDTKSKEEVEIENDDSDIDEAYGEDDLIEFKNFDDIKEGELSVASSDSEDDEDDEGQASDSEYESATDELKTNIFTSNIDLDDIEIELPEWQKIDESLSMTLLQGLSKLGFTKPTEIQAKTIPYALKGEDIMGKASTGSGKTLAYGIPILENLIKSFHAKDTTSCVSLIFTPTRELAQQVTKHLQNVSEKILTGNNKYAILSLTGGLSIQKQERLLKYKGSGRIIVATPGRFLELLEKNTELLDIFAEIKTLVLDEADRLLQDGHFDEFEKILKLLSQRRHQLHGKKSYWQTMIFSATFSIDLFNKLSSNHSNNKLKNKNGTKEGELETVLRHLMEKVHFKSKPLIIDTNPEDKVSSQIKESLIECAPMERDLYVYYFLMMYPGQTLIFCNAIDSVKKLNSYLNFLNVSSFQIHSSMTQKNRLKNLERYEKQSHHNNVLGKPTVLIASDVAARGLDIQGIQHVNGERSVYYFYLGYIMKEIRDEGGINTYQEASRMGQDSNRGGDSSKLLIQWLKDLDYNEKGATALEIGSLSKHNAISTTGIFNPVVRIDLNNHNDEDGIIKQDFMERPIPKTSRDQFDLVSCSLVLNFVPTPRERGDMVHRFGQFLKPDKLTYLFIVLPLPCINNSRYMTLDYFTEMMNSLGFRSVKHHEAKKVCYFLFSYNTSKTTNQTKHKDFSKKHKLQDGPGMNNFSITL